MSSDQWNADEQVYIRVTLPGGHKESQRMTRKDALVWLATYPQTNAMLGELGLPYSWSAIIVPWSEA